MRHGLANMLDGVVAYCRQYDQQEVAARLERAVAWWKKNDNSGD